MFWKRERSIGRRASVESEIKERKIFEENWTKKKLFLPLPKESKLLFFFYEEKIKSLKCSNRKKRKEKLREHIWNGELQHSFNTGQPS